MSANKSATRRLRLLAGSSLAAAGLAALAFAGAPDTAAAQVTCVATTAVTGNGTNTATIAAGTNNPGITCAYTGAAATVSTLGAITVSSVAGGDGINLTAVGAGSLTWTSTAGGITGGAFTNGPVIDARTTTGSITLTTGAVTPNTTSGTDGIFAQATGAGTISLTTGAVGFGNAVGSAAIEAISGGGNIGIVTNGAIGTNGSSFAVNSTNRDGVVAQTSGTGTINLDLRNTVTGFGLGGAAVRVTNGTGDVFITAANAIRGGNAFSSSTSAHLAAGLVIDSDGDVVVESTSVIVGGINVAGARAPGIIASGQTFTLTLTGNAATLVDNVYQYRASLGGYFSSAGFFGGASGDLGSLFGPDIAQHVGGNVDFSGVSGGAELNFNSRARWVLEGASVMSPGADVVNIDATSVLVTTYDFSDTDMSVDVDQTYIQPGVIDFGAGVDVVNNDGRLLLGPAYISNTGVGVAPDLPPLPGARFGLRAEIRLLGLEQFNNSNDIWMGPMFYIAGFDEHQITATDRWHDDMLYMPGATFHGETGSRVIMDVDLNKTQASCAPSTRDADGWLPAADCLGIEGGAATGRTELRIVELIPGDRGRYNPDGLVLVDLAGGDPADTAPDAFFLTAATPRFVDIGNGAIDKGVFLYVLGFDADTQQFKLFGLPSSGTQQFPMIATAAGQLWRTASSGWFERRVRQRDVERDEGLGTGAWFNATGVASTREITTTIPIGSADASFDNTYDQNDVALSFGWDILDHRTDAGSWALGGMVGYAQSQLEFVGGGNGANLEGVHAGFYGGYSVGGFFLDAAASGAWLSLHNDVPSLHLAPTGTVLGTNLRSLGGRIEAGWRWRSGRLSIEPVAGFTVVTTDFDDMRVPNDDPDATRPGVTVRLDSADSRRASAGVRVGLEDLWLDVAPTSLSLTARAVQEFAGEAVMSIANVGPTAPSSDLLEGTFTQITASAGVSNLSKTVAGYLNVDTTFGGDYESLGVSAGLRLQW